MLLTAYYSILHIYIYIFFFDAAVTPEFLPGGIKCYLPSPYSYTTGKQTCFFFLNDQYIVLEWILLALSLSLSHTHAAKHKNTHIMYTQRLVGSDYRVSLSNSVHQIFHRVQININVLDRVSAKRSLAAESWHNNLMEKHNVVLPVHLALAVSGGLLV